MKWLIASDLHGRSTAVAELRKRFEAEKADKILLLGDILFHGPRNGVPDGYDCMKTAEILNSLKDFIICIRGNCDSDVDTCVLEFPILCDHMIIDSDKHMIFATHGHVYNDTSLPPAFRKGDIIIAGHTHVAGVRKAGDGIYINPGSVSIPKGGSWPGYMIYNSLNSVFTLKDLSGTVKCDYDAK